MSSIGDYHNFCESLKNAINQTNLTSAELWFVSQRHKPPLIWDDSEAEYRLIVAHLAPKNSPLTQRATDDKFSLSFNVWITLVPQLKDFWSGFKNSHPNYKGSKLKRIQQYMGFPLDFITSHCVELSVRQSDLFRPCNNPNVEKITDPLTPDLRSSTDLKHKNFLEEAERLYYPDGEGEPLFPWTKRGYTYDWYDLDHPVGASEFVIRKGAEVKLHSIQSIDDYLK